MIKGIAISNGKVRLVLVPDKDNEVDKAVLKMLDGATAKIIKDNLRIGEQSIAEGLIIELDMAPSRQEA